MAQNDAVASTCDVSGGGSAGIWKLSDSAYTEKMAIELAQIYPGDWTTEKVVFWLARKGMSAHTILQFQREFKTLYCIILIH
jgi:hypothetical protein